MLSAVDIASRGAFIICVNINCFLRYSRKIGREESMKEFYPEELLEFDGKDGKPVYIAHQGKVYDVSGSKLWKGGVHMKRHHAGQDLTTDIRAAPHEADVLERYPQIGIVKKKEDVPERVAPKALEKLLRRYPMLRRHPHPMTVHFPIVFMIAAPVFAVLYLLTGNQSFETTSFHCLGTGLFFTPIVILTGFYTWWLNYFAKPTRPISIKQILSGVLLVVALIAFRWRLGVPDVLIDFGPLSIIYLLLVLSLAPMVATIGWFGAELTFPIERE
jgi:predicted heme/steroid binding protein/uncharacterized membrane protein